MKKFILILPAVIIAAAVFILSGRSEIISSTLPRTGQDLPVPPKSKSAAGDEFIIGALENGAEGNYAVLDSARFNLWHRYPSGDNGWITVNNGWKKFDYLEADYSSYGRGVKNILEDNKSQGMKTLMNRPKILYMCFGQRSDYQCEDINSLQDKDYWFYTYKTSETGKDIEDNSTYGSGEYVKYCEASQMNAGYVVKDLRANREQINNIETWGPYAVDSIYKWYVRPRIRIDFDFANNSLNKDKEVCSIEIKRFDGSLMKTVILRVRNFLDDAGKYDGKYHETFKKYDGDNDLSFDPSLNISENLNPLKKPLWDESCKVDFSVKWSGSCDMWIDYVRVENQTAKDLFGGVYEQPQQAWFEWEVKEISESLGDAAWKFYIEEFEFNQLPCMKYVNEKISTFSAGKNSLMCDMNYSTYKIHIPGFSKVVLDAGYFKRTLIDNIGSKEIFMGAFPFLSEGYEYSGGGKHIYIPNSLPKHGYNESAGIFGIDASPDEYDKWLNEYLDEDRNEWFDLVPYFKLANSISRGSDISFINLVQTHVVNWPGHHLREPTNEEINLMVNLGISYGAKGTIYFYMNGSGKFGGKNYDRGLAELNDLGNYDHPRYINVYGQAKWENLKSLNRVQEKWGPYIMSFDNINRHSYIYRTENNLMRRDSYVEDLVSSFNGIDETVSKRYLQLSVFKDNSGINYFMVVNRRCSPVKEGREDGIRNVKILFDINDAAFSNANRWRIIDLFTNSTVLEFDKKSTGNIDLGLFQPGEGKLYKLEPVN
ncbi:MAG: hypothetical protein KBG21_04075 [Ignavibacteria bacterium]|nr:hypothetical protein [Ignavibacteria bacterium]